MVLWTFLFSVIFLGHVIHNVEGRGVLTIRLLNFENKKGRTYDGSCCDHMALDGTTCPDQCDYVMRLIVSGLGRANDHVFLFHRPLKYDANDISFQEEATDMVLTVLFDEWPVNGYVKMNVFFYDYDDNDHTTLLVDWFENDLTRSVSKGNYKSATVMGNRQADKTLLEFEWSVHCFTDEDCLKPPPEWKKWPWDNSGRTPSYITPDRGLTTLPPTTTMDYTDSHTSHRWENGQWKKPMIGNDDDTPAIGSRDDNYSHRRYGMPKSSHGRQSIGKTDLGRSAASPAAGAKHSRGATDSKHHKHRSSRVNSYNHKTRLGGGNNGNNRSYNTTEVKGFVGKDTPAFRISTTPVLKSRYLKGNRHRGEMTTRGFTQARRMKGQRKSGWGIKHGIPPFRRPSGSSTESGWKEKVIYVTSPATARPSPSRLTPFSSSEETYTRKYKSGPGSQIKSRPSPPPPRTTKTWRKETSRKSSSTPTSTRPPARNRSSRGRLAIGSSQKKKKGQVKNVIRKTKHNSRANISKGKKPEQVTRSHKNMEPVTRSQGQTKVKKLYFPRHKWHTQNTPMPWGTRKPAYSQTQRYLKTTSSPTAVVTKMYNGGTTPVSYKQGSRDRVHPALKKTAEDSRKRGRNGQKRKNFGNMLKNRFELQDESEHENKESIYKSPGTIRSRTQHRTEKRKLDRNKKINSPVQDPSKKSNAKQVPNKSYQMTNKNTKGRIVTKPKVTSKARNDNRPSHVSSRTTGRTTRNRVVTRRTTPQRLDAKKTTQRTPSTSQATTRLPSTKKKEVKNINNTRMKTPSTVKPAFKSWSSSKATRGLNPKYRGTTLPSKVKEAVNRKNPQPKHSLRPGVKKTAPKKDTSHQRSTKRPTRTRVKDVTGKQTTDKPHLKPKTSHVVIQATPPSRSTTSPPARSTPKATTRTIQRTNRLRTTTSRKASAQPKLKSTMKSVKSTAVPYKRKNISEKVNTITVATVKTFVSRKPVTKTASVTLTTPTSRINAAKSHRGEDKRRDEQKKASPDTSTRRRWWEWESTATPQTTPPRSSGWTHFTRWWQKSQTTPTVPTPKVLPAGVNNGKVYNIRDWHKLAKQERERNQKISKKTRPILKKAPTEKDNRSPKNKEKSRKKASPKRKVKSQAVIVAQKTNGKSTTTQAATRKLHPTTSSRHVVTSKTYTPNIKIQRSKTTPVNTKRQPETKSSSYLTTTPIVKEKRKSSTSKVYSTTQRSQATQKTRTRQSKFTRAPVIKKRTWGKKHEKGNPPRRPGVTERHTITVPTSTTSLTTRMSKKNNGKMNHRNKPTIRSKTIRTTQKPNTSTAPTSKPKNTKNIIAPNYRKSVNRFKLSGGRNNLKKNTSSKEKITVSPTTKNWRYVTDKKTKQGKTNIWAGLMSTVGITIRGRQYIDAQTTPETPNIHLKSIPRLKSWEEDSYHKSRNGNQGRPSEQNKRINRIDKIQTTKQSRNIHTSSLPSSPPPQLRQTTTPTSTTPTTIDTTVPTTRRSKQNDKKTKNTDTIKLSTQSADKSKKTAGAKTTKKNKASIIPTTKTTTKPTAALPAKPTRWWKRKSKKEKTAHSVRTSKTTDTLVTKPEVITVASTKSWDRNGKKKTRYPSHATVKGVKITNAPKKTADILTMKSTKSWQRLDKKEQTTRTYVKTKSTTTKGLEAVETKLHTTKSWKRKSGNDSPSRMKNGVKLMTTDAPKSFTTVATVKVTRWWNRKGIRGKPTSTSPTKIESKPRDGKRTYFTVRPTRAWQRVGTSSQKPNFGGKHFAGVSTKPPVVIKAKTTKSWKRPRMTTTKGSQTSTHSNKNAETKRGYPRATTRSWRRRTTEGKSTSTSINAKEKKTTDGTNLKTVSKSVSTSHKPRVMGSNSSKHVDISGKTTRHRYVVTTKTVLPRKQTIEVNLKSTEKTHRASEKGIKATTTKQSTMKPALETTSFPTRSTASWLHRGRSTSQMKKKTTSINGKVHTTGDPLRTPAPKYKGQTTNSGNTPDIYGKTKLKGATVHSRNAKKDIMVTPATSESSTEGNQGWNLFEFLPHILGNMYSGDLVNKTKSNPNSAAAGRTSKPSTSLKTVSSSRSNIHGYSVTPTRQQPPTASPRETTSLKKDTSTRSKKHTTPSSKSGNHKSKATGDGLRNMKNSLRTSTPKYTSVRTRTNVTEKSKMKTLPSTVKTSKTASERTTMKMSTTITTSTRATTRNATKKTMTSTTISTTAAAVSKATTGISLGEILTSSTKPVTITLTLPDRITTPEGELDNTKKSKGKHDPRKDSKTKTTKKKTTMPTSTTTVKNTTVSKKTTTTIKKNNVNKKTTTTVKKNNVNKKTTTTVKKNNVNKKTTTTVKKNNVNKKTTTTVKNNVNKKTTTTVKKNKISKKTTTTVKKNKVSKKKNNASKKKTDSNVKHIAVKPTKKKTQHKGIGININLGKPTVKKTNSKTKQRNDNKKIGINVDKPMLKPKSKPKSNTKDSKTIGISIGKPVVKKPDSNKKGTPVNSAPKQKIILLNSTADDGPRLHVPNDGLFVPGNTKIVKVVTSERDENGTLHEEEVLVAIPSNSEAQHIGLQVKRLNIQTVFNRYWPAILGLTIGTVFLVAAVLTSVACRAQRLYVQRTRYDQPQHLTEPPDTSEYSSSAASLVSEATRSSIRL